MRRLPQLLILGATLGVLPAATVQAVTPTPQALLREGRNDEARVALEAMANRHPDDPRWRYNAGVAAFRAGDAATAQRHFEAVTAASDLALQQRAWYNLGNSWFQLANAQEAEDREGTLRKAEEAFEAAAQLAPQDRNATENLAAVRKLAEELKKQQQQQEQESSDKDPQKNKQKQKDPRKSQDQKNSKQKGDKDQKDPQEGQQGQDNPSDSADGKSGDKSKDQAKKDRKKPGEPGAKKDPETSPDVAHSPTNAPSSGSRTNQTAQAGKDREKEKGKDGDKGGIQRGEGSDAPGAEGQASTAEVAERMTVMQAQQMLDAQKGSEKPIWTLVRNWGQENTPPPSGSNRRKSW